MGSVSCKSNLKQLTASFLKSNSKIINMKIVSTGKYCCAKKNVKKKKTNIKMSAGALCGTQTTFNFSFMDRNDRGDKSVNSGAKTTSHSKESFLSNAVVTTRADALLFSHSNSKYFTTKIKKRTLMHSRIRYEDIKDFYTFENTILGTGISGAVCQARHIATDGLFAVKSLSTQNISAKKASMIYNEVAIYLQVDHPNIAKLFEVYEDQNSVHLVMELCAGKELYDRLALKRRYSEQDAIRVIKQMLSAINYCHTHRICHRDLKLENWVYSDTSEDSSIKLIDFGFSRAFTMGVPMAAMHGTVYYVSPEVIDGCYTHNCDIWSIGVILYMLLSGSPPFNGNADNEILVKIKKGDFQMDGNRWTGVSPLAKNFVSYLLRKNYDERPSAQLALKHPWLTQQNSDYLDIEIEALRNMQKFVEFNIIKKAALVIISFLVSPQELKNLEMLFKKIDENSNGAIELEELKVVLKKHFDISDNEVHKIFKGIDQTGSFEIHYSDFLASTMQRDIAINESWVRQAFSRFDLDGNGIITLSNLIEIFADTYEEASIKEILAYCDLNHSGDIDYDEFLAVMNGDELNLNFMSS